MMTKNRSRQRSMLKYVAILPLTLMLTLILWQKDALANFTLADNYLESQTRVEPLATNLPEKVTDLGDVDEMARFPGCEDVVDVREKILCSLNKMKEFLTNNIKYPEEAEKAGIEGTVVIEITVKEDGSLADFNILKDVDGGCGAEALRVMKMMPRWIPGKKDGKAVSTTLKLPVKFALPKDEKAGDTPRTNVDPGDNTYQVVEQMPEFPGCADIEDSAERAQCSNKKLMEFIFSNVKYPEEAHRKGVEGMVVAKFVVDKDGNVIDPAIVKEPGEGLGEEVLRVINLMNEMPEKWTPGQEGGKKVNVLLTFPVKFKTEKEPDAPVDGMSDKPALELQLFNAFPNPTTGNLNLEIGEVNLPTTIRITDINGREVFTQKVDKIETGTIKINDIDVSKATKGNLFIVVEQGGKTISKKIVLQ